METVMKKPRKKRETTLAREQAMMTEFIRLSNIQEDGVKKHSFDWIVEQLHQKFFYKKSTIEKKLQELR